MSAAIGVYVHGVPLQICRKVASTDSSSCSDGRFRYRLKKSLGVGWELYSASWAWYWDVFFSVSATCVGYFNSLYYAAVQFHPPLVELLAQLKGPFKHCTRWIFFCVSRQIISELSTEGTIRNSALINIASVSLLTHDTLKYQSSFWCLWLITTFIHSFFLSSIHSFTHSVWKRLIFFTNVNSVGPLFLVTVQITRARNLVIQQSIASSQKDCRQKES